MNAENLEILAKFLEELPQDKFDISDWAEDQYGDSLNIYAHECMTVGCAVGWAPAAGLQVSLDDTNWARYSKRVFGMEPYGEDSRAWDWCFHGEWHQIDNTPTGAAKRIRHLIQNGLPDDYFEQLWGRAPYTFAVAA